MNNIDWNRKWSSEHLRSPLGSDKHNLFIAIRNMRHEFYDYNEHGWPVTEYGMNGFETVFRNQMSIPGDFPMPTMEQRLETLHHQQCEHFQNELHMAYGMNHRGAELLTEMNASELIYQPPKNK